MRAVRSAFTNVLGASIALSIFGVRSVYGSVFGGESCQ